MARIAIVVHFRIKPGAWEKFDTLIRDHAARTLKEEPGCERFDVLQPLAAAGGDADRSRVMLYEVYRDQAALDAHTRNPRLAVVREAYAALIDGRELTICGLA
jgi:autoinducer 2-degrading protein